jgi:dienelactone hydrolase
MSPLPRVLACAAGRCGRAAAAAVALLAMLYGCAIEPSPSQPATQSGTALRDDGSAIHWQLARRLADGPKPVLLVAQGSGCAPARRNANIDLLAARLPEFAVLTIEKYGVDPDSAPADSTSACAEAYYAHHTVSQSVADARRVLATLRRNALWDGRLVVFGGSEGGAVVSILARESADVDAVVVFSSGTGLTIAEFLPLVVPGPVAEQMTRVFAEARSNPLSAGVAGGNSLRWWADIMDRRLSDDLLASSAPILLVHGVNDREAPLAAARATRDAFAAAEQPQRLAYWELADRDHQMRDASGQSHLGDVLDDVARWIRAQPLQ